MRPDEVLSEDRDYIQYYRPDDHYQIGREEIREFARSMKDGHIIHWDDVAAAELGHSGLVAPLTFAARLAGTGLNWLMDNVLVEHDTSSFVQTDQVFNYYRPLHAGDQISLYIGLHPVRRKAGGDTIVVDGLMFDQHGDLVQSLTTTAVGRRGAHAEPALAAALADVMMADFIPPHSVQWTPIEDAPTHTPAAYDRPDDPSVPLFSEVSVGDVIGTRTVTVRRGDLVTYAGISSDYNPIHWSDRVVDIVGLETVAAHGLLTMGIGSTFICSWLGDPTAVLDYRVRFTGIAYVSDVAPADIQYTGRIKSLDAATKTATIALEAAFRGKRIFGRALATVALR
ncbi:fused (3R)-hydroxyacyl-ACP dehydratase subunits HadA/HadB [Williamsia sp. CHRR-6]|uniref:fused (3R)-hydroxyacyl-ACP dehydratase subunits HadA/HadB n=1 Tax=Williamsia sp. CHRR-6 TaxID=2835871 RepID=UPI001BD98AB7|nr:fused (3R)-hydroxyacyl-ACP dehydratase subunits HadA/HadB [Williamsia sp. CHRR-6]MBT0568439.1 MaoC family dehydratase N-terminal domain-containing protein [Williamsia sp. CHRR-6]